MPYKKRNQRSIDRYLRGTTNFYPLYGEGRDVVEAVLPVHPTRFQTVIPRYRLSATETRDEGVGPAFDETPYRSPAFRRTRLPVLKPKAPLPRQVSSVRKKIRVNFSA